MPIEFAERIRRIPSYPVAAGYDLGADVAQFAGTVQSANPLAQIVVSQSVLP